MEHTHCLSPARAREAEATVTSSSYARLFPDLPAFTADEAFLYAVMFQFSGRPYGHAARS